MPGSKARSSTSKASSAAKGSLGFSSTKKGVSSSGKPAGKKSAEPAEPPASASSSLSGLYPRLYKESLKKMGPPIHREEMTDGIEIILRVFDSSDEFGPSSRISRLERFERAERLGLNPDPEIGEILRSQEGRSTKVYADSVFQI